MGLNSGKIRNCCSIVNIKGESTLGGITGKNNSSHTSITNSYSVVNICGVDNIGGLTGYNKNGNVLNSYSTGYIEGTKENIGGIVGKNEGVNKKNGRVWNCIAFNSNIVGKTNVNRVVSLNNSGYLNNNYANNKMNIQTTIHVKLNNNENGEDIKCFNMSRAPIDQWDTNSNKDSFYWSMPEGTDRPLIYIDPDEDGPIGFRQLGNDDGKIVPNIIDYSPENEVYDVEVTTSQVLNLTFDMDVTAATGELIVFKVVKDNESEKVDSIQINDSDVVKVNKSLVTIILTNELEANTEYYIYISPDSFVAEDKYKYKGLTKSKEWIFKTKK